MPGSHQATCHASNGKLWQHSDKSQCALTLPAPPCCCCCMLPPHWPPCMPRPAAQPPPPAASLLLPAPSVSELLPLSLPPAAGADVPGLPLPGRGGPRSCSPRRMRNSSSLQSHHVGRGTCASAVDASSQALVLVCGKLGVRNACGWVPLTHYCAQELLVYPGCISMAIHLCHPSMTALLEAVAPRLAFADSTVRLH
jgi:hypothetical protein